MPIPDLGSASVTPFDPRRRAPYRHPLHNPPPRRLPEDAVSPPLSVEPSFLAPVVVPDFSQLTYRPEATPAAPGVSAGEQVFYDHLNRLIAAIRKGDLALARAVVEALETQMLVERSAGRAPPAIRSGEPAPAPVEEVDAIYETLAHYLVTDGLTS